MNLNSRTKTENTSCGDDMLPKHLVHPIFTDHVINEEVREIITGHIRQHKDIMSTVRMRKREWYGHFTRSNGRRKHPPRHTGKRWKRWRGRQKKKQQNYTKEWTGLDFYVSQVAAKDLHMWKQVVTLSSEVPQRQYMVRCK